MNSNRALVRALVDNVYDTQATRIAVGNRLIASLRSMGVVDIPKNENGESVDPTAENKEDSKLLSNILVEYERVSETYAEQFGSRGSIRKALQLHQVDNVYVREELTYNSVSVFVELSKTEKKLLDMLGKEVKNHPMWDAFFKDVKGCGTLMAAVCISYFDPYKARYVSSFWKYAGLDVVSDENGSHGRRNSDYVMVTYTDRNGQEKEKKSLGYNPFVKTKLIGVLGTSFLRAGKDAYYAKIYYDYKNRLENRPDCADLRPVVIHRRAIRYAVKLFLKDMWMTWRALEGLPVGDDYAVGKLGYPPHHAPRNEVTSDDILEKAASL